MSCARASRSVRALRLGHADLEHLARVVPLVDRRADVQALVALQADQAAVQGLGQNLADLGLADAGLALEEQGPAELEREVERGRERPVGDVVAARQKRLGVVDGGDLGHLRSIAPSLPVPCALQTASRRLEALPPRSLRASAASGPSARSIVARSGGAPCGSRRQRHRHRLDVPRRRAAAAADDARAGIARQAGVVRHDLGRAVVADLAVVIVRQAAVALGDDHIAGLGGARQAEHALDQLRRPDAAIGAERHRADREIVAQAHRRLAGQAHHGAAAGVEGHGGDDRQAGRAPRPRPQPRAPRPTRSSRSKADRRRPRPAPAACSANTASPSAAVEAPRRARRSRRSGRCRPRPAPGVRPRRPASRASLAAARFSSATRASAPCSMRRMRLAPKLLVRSRSLPASTKPWWTARTWSGRSRFQSSGEPPVSRPRANRLVPIAPSASSTRLAASRRASGSIGARRPAARACGRGAAAGWRRRCRTADALRVAAHAQLQHDLDTLGRLTSGPARDLVGRAQAAEAGAVGRIERADADAGGRDLHGHAVSWRSARLERPAHRGVARSTVLR